MGGIYLKRYLGCGIKSYSMEILCAIGKLFINNGYYVDHFVEEILIYYQDPVYRILHHGDWEWEGFE